MANQPDRGLLDLVRAIEKIGVHDHLCLIYETQEEQFSAILPFMKIGLERGEKCIYIVDDNTAAMVINGMKAAGIEVESAVESRQLTIASKHYTYMEQGYFDPDWMIGFFKRAADEAKAEGYSALRVTYEMTWALGGDPGTERLMEYEAKLNYFFPDNDALAICQYNRNRFSPQIIKDVISTHPLVISGGMVCRNFYYVPPDDFLGEEQPAREVGRLLANIINWKKVEEELRRHQERLEELIRELENKSGVEEGREPDRHSSERPATEERGVGAATLAHDSTERKRAEEEIRKGGVYTRSLIEASLDPLVTIRPDGRITDVNAATENVTGYTREELIGTDFSDYFTEPEKAWAGYRQAFQEGLVRDYPLEVRHREGQVTSVLCNASVYRDEDGQVLGVFAAAHDITERQQSEKTMRFLSSIVEYSDDAIIGKNLEGIITSWNKGAEKIYGYEKSEVTGKPLSLLIPDERQDEELRFFEKIRRGEHIEHFETVRRRKDGQLINVSLTISPIIDAEERVVGASTIARDVTERKRAEEEIVYAEPDRSQPRSPGNDRFGRQDHRRKRSHRDRDGFHPGAAYRYRLLGLFHRTRESPGRVSTGISGRTGA